MTANRDVSQPQNRRGRRGRTLNALAAQGRQGEPGPVAQEVVDAARGLLDADGADLYWWEDDAAILSPLAQNDPQALPPMPVLRPGQGVAGSAFQNCAPVVVADYQNWPGARPWARAAALRSMLAVPLLAGDRALGVVTVQSYTPRNFTPAQVKALVELAAQVAPAMEDMRVHAALQRRRAEAEALAELMRRGAEEPDAEQVIQLLTRFAGLLLGADYTAVALVGEDGVTRWHGVWGNRSTVWCAPSYRPGRGTPGRVMGPGRTVLLERLGDNPDDPLASYPIHQQEGGRTALGTPMTSGGQRIGALLLGWRSEVAISPAQVGLAETLASYAATIIDAARARVRLEELAHDAIASEARLRTVYGAMACGVVTIDAMGQIVDANEAAKHIVGLDLAEMRQWGILGLRERATPLHELPFVRPAAALGVLQLRAPARNIVLAFHRPDGAERWLQLDAVPVLTADGALDQVVLSFVDVTDREAAQAALRASEERFRAQYKGIPVPTYTWQHVGDDWVLVDCNTAAEAFTHGRITAFLGTPARDFYAERPQALDDLAQCCAERKTIQRAMSWCLRSTGEQKELIVTYVFAPPDVVMVHTEDVTERNSAQVALQHQALHDALTDLPNRVLFNDRTEQAIRTARRQGAQVALLLLDLDRFKEINDAFGHRRGDLLLREVADRLGGALRDGDTVARLGGDEFAVLLPSAQAGDVPSAADRIGAALDAPFTVEGRALQVKASIGAALYPIHGLDAETLLRRADLAMYKAKRGGDRYALYTAEQERHTADRLILTTDLRRAIDQGDLVLHYQPTVEVATHNVPGVEALVRWQHPERGLIPPDQFIALAEQTGLIVPLTRWVLQEAIRQCRAWQRRGLVLGVAVNLSMVNLHDPQLPETIAALLRRYGVQPARLRVELTESTIMADAERALAVLQRLAGMGVRISVDDFGTGYSSLAYLKRLPVDELKIDQSFVRHLTGDETDAAIVRSTISLAHSLGLRVVAEGVETCDAWDLLTQLGCDVAQGYYLSRPVPAAAVAPWLRKRAGAAA